MKRKPFIIFFTGLTNSGKTTLSQLLFQYLKDIGLKQIKNIDGDKFRRKINNFIYSNKGRKFVGDKKIKYAKLLTNKGYNVIISGVAPNRKWRKKNKRIKNFFEIYLNCSFRETIRRNKRRKEKKFLDQDKNNVIGLDQPYERGDSQDLTINTSNLNKKKSLKKIIDFLERKKIIN